MSKFNIFILALLTINLFIFSNLSAQVVWKSDGTIIGSDGEIKTESYGARFQKQLINPTKEWPKASGYGESIKNYFGNNIFLPGTPLLRMSGIDFNSDYSRKLAELNLFENSTEMQRYIVANANHDFLEDLELSEDEAILYISKIDIENIASNSEVQSLLLDKKNKIGLKNLNNQLSSKVGNEISKEVGNKVEESVKKEVEDKVNEAVQESIESRIEYNLDAYFDQLEAEYEAMGWTVCERTGDSLTASSGSC